MADNAFLNLSHVRRSGRRAVLVTVVRSAGSSYRRPGASAVIMEGGEVIGAVSGGCLQSDMLETAAAVLNGGLPRLLTYDTAAPDDLLFGTGSGCGGLVQLLIAPVPDDVLDAVVARLHEGLPAVVETVVTPGPTLGQRRLGEWRPDLPAVSYEGDLLRHVAQPPTTLLLCGAGDDARPVATLAAAAGFRVIVADHRPAWVTPHRFPVAHQTVICDCAQLPSQVTLPAGSYAVLLTHQFDRDLAHLKVLLDRPTAYIGMLGSRERSRQLVDALLAERPDLAGAVESKLHAPVGLDIGADGPEEIALSIVAELVAHRSGRPGTSLGLFHRKQGVSPA